MSESPEQKADIATCAEKQEDLDPENVHSANSWESVDLGDDDRKKKFLRLMGASKKEHSGRFVIGDKEPAQKHSREKTDTEKLNQDLEDQFLTSKERRVNRYNHKGLGFADAPPEQLLCRDYDRPKSDSDNVVGSSTEADSASGDGNHKDGDDRRVSEGSRQEHDKKRESDQPDSTANIPPKKPKMMMNFVKASD